MDRVKTNWKEIRTIPSHELTKEMIYAALEQDGCTLRYVPHHLIDKDMIEYAMNLEPDKRYDYLLHMKLFGRM